MVYKHRHSLQWFSAAMSLLLLGASVLSSATLSTSVTTDKFSVGDKIRFSVTTIVDKGTAVSPLFAETDFGKLTVKEWNLIKTERETTDSLLYEYNITSYTPEPCTIPPLRFLIEKDGVSDTLTTDPVPLQIISVIPSDTVDIMEMKAPLTAGEKPKWWLWLTITIAGIMLLTAAGIVLYRKLKRPPPLPPPIPPYEEAIDALAQLGVKKYLQRGLVREYVFELSEIFKNYVARRFECNATDFTTEEIIAWAGAGSLQQPLRTSLEWFFRTTDPVKFARLIPDNSIIERFETEVRAFLEATKPVVEQASPEPETFKAPSEGADK